MKLVARGVEIFLGRTLETIGDGHQSLDPHLLLEMAPVELRERRVQRVILIVRMLEQLGNIREQGGVAA
ncbi:hypothetical protein GCM10017767_06000 [Halomonas urumqiensis]|nr:hypothetical protein GCM10017767_06000 [Halomonas urumqiensis]